MNKIEKLEALYATLPTVQCQRKCQQYCGPIVLSKLEAKRLEDKRGYLETVAAWEPAVRNYLPAPDIMLAEFVGLKPQDPPDNLSCIFLSDFGKCTAYDIRPLICRVWGMVDSPLLRCPYGCVPTRWLTEQEYKNLLLKIIAIQKGER